jgi:hypothetical protein
VVVDPQLRRGRRDYTAYQKVSSGVSRTVGACMARSTNPSISMDAPEPVMTEQTVAPSGGDNPFARCLEFMPPVAGGVESMRKEGYAGESSGTY